MFYIFLYDYISAYKNVLKNITIIFVICMQIGIREYYVSDKHKNVYRMHRIMQ